jgi:hypothetical protein
VANIGLAYDNLIDEGTVASGSWESAMPLSNAQDRLLSKFARSTDNTAANTYFDFDLGSAQTCGIFGLIRHNLTTAATVRVVLSLTSDFTGIPFDLTGATLVYDTGAVLAWPSVVATEDTEWENDNWFLGQNAAETVAAYGQTNFLHVINGGSAVSARYGRVYISDPSNGAGHVQFGRAWAGPFFQPRVNMVFGKSLAWKTLTTSRTALGGVMYHRKRRMVRVVRFGLDGLGEAEAYTVFNIQRVLDTDGQVIVIDDPANDTYSFASDFLGNLTRPSAITHPDFTRYSTAFEIQEEV